MTPRERVLASIAHREPDRVPVDLGSTPSSGISAIAYNRLKARLGLDLGLTRVYDVVQQLAEPDDAVLDLLEVDVLDIGRVFHDDPSRWVETTLRDGERALYPHWFEPELRDDGSFVARAADGSVIAEMPPSGTFFDQTVFPYADGYPSSFAKLDDAMEMVLWAAFPHSPWDRCDEAGFWDALRERTLELRARTDRALMVVVGCNLFEWGTFLRRMDNFLMDLAAAPSDVERLLDALLERHLGTLEKVCRAVGDTVDIVRFGDDLGMHTGPLLSPATYRKLFQPRHRVLCQYVREHSSMHTFLHSCGSIHALIPDLIEAGFEILNPVQTSCRKMEPERLKREFGRDVTFWGGGCDTREVLHGATPSAVRAHVRERLEVFSPGGGFVFNTVHNILPDVPPDNVVAMFEAVREWNERP